MERSKFRKHTSMVDRRLTVLSSRGDTTTTLARSSPSDQRVSAPLSDPRSSTVEELSTRPVLKVLVRWLQGKGVRAFFNRSRSRFSPSLGVAIHLLACRGGRGFELPPIPPQECDSPNPGGIKLIVFSGGGFSGTRGRWCLVCSSLAASAPLIRGATRDG